MKQLLEKVIPKLYGFYFNVLGIFSSKTAGKQAVILFSKPRKGKLLEAHKKFLDTARQQRIAFDEGLFMLYHWAGSGPTLLLLHGWESNSYRWKYIHPELVKRDYNIIAIDAPAHGATDGTTFTAIKYAGLVKTITDLYQPEIIMAHSAGAMASCYHLHQYKHPYLKKLILLGTPNSMEVILKGYKNFVGFNHKVYRALEQYIFDTYQLRMDDFMCSAFAKAITAPTLLLHNKKDPIVPSRASKDIHKSITNSRLHITNTGGHSLHTKENTDHILDFLDNGI